MAARDENVSRPHGARASGAQACPEAQSHDTKACGLSVTLPFSISTDSRQSVVGRLRIPFPLSRTSKMPLLKLTRLSQTILEAREELKATVGMRCPVYVSVWTGIKQRGLCISCAFQTGAGSIGVAREEKLVGVKSWHGLSERNAFVAGPKYYGNLDWVSRGEVATCYNRSHGVWQGRKWKNYNECNTVSPSRRRRVAQDYCPGLLPGCSVANHINHCAFRSIFTTS